MIFESEIFNLNFENDVCYLSFKTFDFLPFITHGLSTKFGGVSNGQYKSMNLGFSGGDDKNNVFKNYEIFCKAIGIDSHSIVASAQDHNTYIRTVTKSDKGIGIYREKDLTSVDGLITNQAGVSLAIYFADCVPVLFVDPVKKVIAAAHAGWRGTVGLIAEKMVLKMLQQYGCNPEDILVGIGPSIGQCCYEVDKEVADKFEKSNAFDCDEIIRSVGNGKFMVNLQQANIQLLLKRGIRPENIACTDICTKCYKDLLFSHRATKGKRGVMAAVIQIKE